MPGRMALIPRSAALTIIAARALVWSRKCRPLSPVCPRAFHRATPASALFVSGAEKFRLASSDHDSESDGSASRVGPIPTSMTRNGNTSPRFDPDIAEVSASLWIASSCAVTRSRLNAERCPWPFSPITT